MAETDFWTRLKADPAPPIMDGAPRLIVTVMHAELDATDAALPAARAVWDGPIAVYPNAGHLDADAYEWRDDGVSAPDAFAARARAWADGGANILGGCCGIGPGHIAALTRAAERR